MPHKIELGTEAQENLLQRLFYVENLKVGSDRLWKYCKDQHPEVPLNRRQVGTWLMKQEIWQRTFKPNRERAVTKSIVQSVGEIGYLQVDLKYATLPIIRQNTYFLVVIDVFSKLST